MTVVEGFFFDAGDVKNYPKTARPYRKGATSCEQAAAFHALGDTVPLQQHRASWKSGGKARMCTLFDRDATYAEMKDSIGEMLNAGLLGYPFINADMVVECAKACGRTGEPMMRSLEYAYPGHGWETVRDQFLMGERLLVAPQVEEGATSRRVVIPPGTWKADDGEIHVGPRTIEVSTPLARLPHFTRQADSDR